MDNNAIYNPNSHPKMTHNRINIQPTRGYVRVRDPN